MMKVFRISLLFLILTACNSPKAVYDYDNQVNFSGYNSYALFPEFNTGLSQLDQKRLVAGLKTHLESKGFHNNSEEPQLYINVYSEEFQQDNRSRLGVGLGGGGGNVGVGVSGGIPIGELDTYLQLTFDFIDVKDDSLIWQAVVEAPFNFNASPEKRKEQFNRIVKKALEGYPPGKD